MTADVEYPDEPAGPFPEPPGTETDRAGWEIAFRCLEDAAPDDREEAPPW